MAKSGYKVGLALDEVSKEALSKSGLKWEKVTPREKIVFLVDKYMGVPYKFGASVSKDAPEAFDCSSFTAYLYAQAGIAIPRICNDQFKFGKEIPEPEALPGDLVFFKSSRDDIPPDAVGHNGIYVGNGEFIHAGGVKMGYAKVVREKITESRYYPTGFMGYFRLIPKEEERYVVEVTDDRPDLRKRENLVQEINKYV